MKGIKTMALALAAVGLVSCDTAAPDTRDMFNTMHTLTAGDAALVQSATGKAGGSTMSNTQLEQHIIDAIGTATRTIEAAFEDLESEAVAQALIDAQRRGVRVRVVGDIDRSEQAGFVKLTSNGGLEPNGPGRDGQAVVFGNGELTYNPQLIAVITRPGEQNRMTHNFVIIDELRVINLTGGFFAGNPDVAQIGFDSKSEDLGKDFGDEFNQLHGGQFSIVLDTFNGPQKSNTNNRTHYVNDLGDLEVYFGPQERLLKRVVDEVYNARASVHVVGEEFTNFFLSEALIYKAINGFNVGVVVDTDGADVDFSKLEIMQNAFDDVRGGSDVLPTIRTADNIRLNMIIIDADRSPINGKQYRTRVFVLSEPLLEAIAFTAGNQPTPRAADAFADANMWVLNRFVTQPNTNVERFIDIYDELFERGN